MILFFDRSVGTSIPRALQTLLPGRFIDVRYHDREFKKNEPDEVWLEKVGRDGWFVIGQDNSYHKRPGELYALVQYNLGCFYLPGMNAPKWETMRVFAAAYHNIIEKAQTTTRPFIYVVKTNGNLIKQDIPRSLDMFAIPENAPLSMDAIPRPGRRTVRN